MTIITVNKERSGFEIIFDTNMKFLISEQLFTKFRFYSGKEINDIEFEEFVIAANVDKVHQKILAILSKKQVSVSTLKTKINDFIYKNNLEKLDDNSWNAEIQKFTELGLLNDRTLISQIIESYLSKKKGKNYIKQKLFQLGFERTLIQEKLDNTEESSDDLESMMQKKFESLKTKEKDKRKLFEKLVRFGIGRGFESAKVIKITKIILSSLNT